MKIFRIFGVNIQVTSLLEILPMSRNNEKVFYAVGRGREIGIYNSWKECKTQTEGICNAKYRKFYTLEEAEEFVNFWKNYSSGVKESYESEDLVSNVSHWKGLAVSGRRNQYSSKKEKFTKSTNITHFTKHKSNFILGTQNNKEEYRNDSTSCLTPYISPLSSIGFSYTSLKIKKKHGKLKNSCEISKPKEPSEFINKYNQSDSRTPSFSHSEDVVNSEVQSLRLKGNVENDDSFKCSEQTVFNSTSDTSLDVLSDNKNFITPIQNSIIQSDPLDKSITSNESSFVVPHCEIVSNLKKEVDVDCSEQNEKLSQNESSQNKEEIAGINDKLISCLKILESAVKAIVDRNSDESERVKNSLKALLERILTNTNTNVNPQMEPEQNVDKICEESKSCEAQPAESASSPHQPSSQKSCEHLQSLSLHSTSFEVRGDQKNVDVLAVNLRMDSLEKRFDAFLKDIGAIASEISHLKAQIKELRECSKSAFTSGSFHSPKKKEDGMLQTTLNFSTNFAKTSQSWYQSGQKSSADSGNNSEKPKKSTLKRKLSSSSVSGSPKRFAEDGEEIDDLLSKIKTESVDYTSFIVDEDDYVEVYTDGAAQSNGMKNAKAGIGIWFGDSHPMNIAEAVVGKPTNSMAEIQAARVAIQLAIKAGIRKLKIFTDSEFLINCATKWIDRWKKNGWTLSTGGPVKNRKELEKLDKAASKISVRWEKVLGHAGIKGNEMADRLANEGARKYNI